VPFDVLKRRRSVLRRRTRQTSDKSGGFQEVELMLAHHHRRPFSRALALRPRRLRRLRPGASLRRASRADARGASGGNPPARRFVLAQMSPAAGAVSRRARRQQADTHRGCLSFQVSFYSAPGVRCAREPPFFPTEDAGRVRVRSDRARPAPPSFAAAKSTAAVRDRRDPRKRASPRWRRDERPPRGGSLETVRFATAPPA